MIKCYNCGSVFDEDELEHREENVGEFWGAPAYMKVDICPHCGSDEIDDLPETEDDEEADNEQ
jgi:RNA polymerase subunit RPABC4/transcription elongation factor Spt4